MSAFCMYVVYSVVRARADFYALKKPLHNESSCWDVLSIITAIIVAIICCSARKKILCNYTYWEKNWHETCQKQESVQILDDFIHILTLVFVKLALLLSIFCWKNEVFLIWLLWTFSSHNSLLHNQNPSYVIDSIRVRVDMIF